MPANLEQVLRSAERGDLSLENRLAPETRRLIRQVDSSVKRLTWAVVSMGVLLSGVALRIYEGPNWGNNSFFVVAGLIFLVKIVR